MKDLESQLDSLRSANLNLEGLLRESRGSNDDLTEDLGKKIQALEERLREEGASKKAAEEALKESNKEKEDLMGEKAELISKVGGWVVLPL